jgi:hypothetical protein
MASVSNRFAPTAEQKNWGYESTLHCGWQVGDRRTEKKVRYAVLDQDREFLIPVKASQLETCLTLVELRSLDREDLKIIPQELLRAIRNEFCLALHSLSQNRLETPKNCDKTFQSIGNDVRVYQERREYHDRVALLQIHLKAIDGVLQPFSGPRVSFKF